MMIWSGITTIIMMVMSNKNTNDLQLKPLVETTEILPSKFSTTTLKTTKYLVKKYKTHTFFFKITHPQQSLPTP